MQQQLILQVDNIGIKFDLSLCKEDEKPFYYKYYIIPWQKLNNTIFFVFEDISSDFVNLIELHYDFDYILIKVNDHQVLSFLNSHFSTLEFTSNNLYYRNSRLSAKSIKLSSVIYASFTTTISTLTLIERYAYFDFALIFILISILIIGYSSSLFKLVTTVFSLYRTSDQNADYNDFNDKDLPIYTILLPIFKENAVV
ncbi:MAG: hypothetical protein PV340_02085 [Wolbachia sp.]|nr:hypothetical protein [Wolbachia sp.]MDD9335998.1 hypothetical protein [Wolbachia sp.]